MGAGDAIVTTRAPGAGMRPIRKPAKDLVFGRHCSLKLINVTIPVQDGAEVFLDGSFGFLVADDGLPFVLLRCHDGSPAKHSLLSYVDPGTFDFDCFFEAESAPGLD
jgi:hypothetical protein